MRIESLLVVLVSFCLLLTVGAELSARLGLLGVLVAEVALVLVPAWLWVGFRQVPSERIGIARAQLRPLGIAAGVLAGLGAFYVMAVLEATVLERLLPIPPEVKASLERMVLPASGARPLAADLLALAVAPALCEEALFRGAVLPAWRRAREPWSAILMAALLFGAFHASLYRLIPATLLGIALGVVRVRADALAPAVAFHVANNVAVIVLVRLGLDQPPSLQTATGKTLLALAVLALTVGIGLTKPQAQRA